MKLPSDTIVGQYLQITCIFIGAAIAFVYTCGLTFGLLVHGLNDTLCGLTREQSWKNVLSEALKLLYATMTKLLNTGKLLLTI